MSTTDKTPEKVDTVSVTIDGIQVDVPKDTLVIRAAEQLANTLRDEGKTPVMYVVGLKGESYYRFRNRPPHRAWTPYKENEIPELGREAQTPRPVELDGLRASEVDDGEFVEEWPDITDPTGVLIDHREAAWVISGQLHRVLKYGLDGELQHSWGAYGGSGGVAGGLSRPHQIDVDQEGNVYVASWSGGWLNKFVPRPDADPSELIGRGLVLER